jgi:methane/ammonia monooxygenase subunit C
MSTSALPTAASGLASSAPSSADDTRKVSYYARFQIFAFGIVVLAVIYAGLRVYQQLYAWDTGLDSTAAEFDRYWMTLVYVEVPLIFGSAFAIWLYLWVTRDRNLAAVPPAIELRRYFTFSLWLVAYTFAIYFIGSFFAEGDAVWHQTVIRDTAFTPSHNVLFYACIPLYILLSVGGFIYAMTRLPAFSRGVSVAHALAVLGPALILPNLGFNEWGHAYWLTEEIFSHPLHWGFVVLAWPALALPGVALQMIQRMIPLMRTTMGVKADLPQ